MSTPRLPEGMIIVLGRQFGSGGRRIGRRLAEEFGLAYYDKEVLAEAAGRLGFTRQVFDRCDERRPSAFRTFLSNAFGVPDALMQNPMSNEAIYEAQSRVISQLAQEGGCVFVGRTADYILRHHPHMVSIFLHAPLPHRARSVMKRGEEETLEKATERARRFDRNREEFYNYFTGRKWGHADNYHLCIDTSMLSDDGVFRVISAYLASKYAPADD